MKFPTMFANFRIRAKKLTLFEVSEKLETMDTAKKFSFYKTIKLSRRKNSIVFVKILFEKIAGARSVENSSTYNLCKCLNQSFQYESVLKTTVALSFCKICRGQSSLIP